MNGLRRYPVLVLTGGLGSGKTTLLGAWLAQAPLRQAALVINEIGATGFDDQLLRPMMSATDGATLIANACVCCSGLPDLGAALSALFRARLEHRIAPFDRIVVETTGLAEPQALRAAFTADAALRERFVLEGIVTTVSATTAAAFDHDRADLRAELRAQVIGADVLIITKTDRVVTHACDALAQRLQALNATAAISRSALADLPVLQVLEVLARRGAATVRHDATRPAAAQAAQVHGDTLQPATAALPPVAQMLANAAALAHDHDNHHGHHGHHDHDAATRFVSLPEALPRARLAERLNRAIASAADRLLRLKGIVRADDGGLIAVQWAPGDATASLAPFAGNPPALGLQWIATDLTTLDQLATACAAFIPLAQPMEHP